jgi:hypothetical protein
MIFEGSDGSFGRIHSVVVGFDQLMPLLVMARFIARE